MPPIRRQLVVAGPPDLAWSVFTGEIGRWWPVGAGHSVHGSGSTVEFRDGILVETSGTGEESVWGRVLAWDPPHSLSLTWHPGTDPSDATEVSVTFLPVAGGQTLVTLEHRGWERLSMVEKRENYRVGWQFVLGRFEDALAKDEAGSSEGPVWLALLHTAGGALSTGESVFAHPDFAEHLAFLERLRGRGALVAAGPLDGSDGMTVLRVPAAADVAEYVRLAQEDDLSVARDLLQVRVRPWRVALTG